MIIEFLSIGNDPVIEFTLDNIYCGGIGNRVREPHGSCEERLKTRESKNTLMAVPKKIFFTRGVGIHKDRLASFELALRQSGIEKCNLVYVSSIFPPNCKQLSVEEGLQLLQPGEITYVVMAKKRNQRTEPVDICCNRSCITQRHAGVRVFVGTPCIWRDAGADRGICRRSRRNHACDNVWDRV